MQDRWQYRWKDYGFYCVDKRFTPVAIALKKGKKKMTNTISYQRSDATADMMTQTTKRGGAQLDHIQQVD